MTLLVGIAIGIAIPILGFLGWKFYKRAKYMLGG